MTQYLVHIIPSVCCLVNTLITNAVMDPSVFNIFLKIGIAYLGVNCAVSKLNQKPLYNFLTWESWDSLAICAGIIFFTYIIFYALCAIDRLLKRSRF